MSNDRTRTTVLKDAQEEDIEFTVVKPRSSIETKTEVKTQTESKQSKTRTNISLKEKIQTEKAKELRLEKVDYAARGPKQTLTEQYQKLQKREKILDEDVYVYASPVSRAMALVIDQIFNIALIYASIMVAPIELKLIDLFNDKYNLALSLPRTMVLSALTMTTIFFAFFFFVVIPTAFYNRSLGKKMTGLYVRGTQTFTLSISQIFMRELFCKPISMALIIGFFLPFFDKKKQSIHDKMTGTLVIKE